MNNAIALLHSKNESYLLIMTYPIDDGQQFHTMYKKLYIGNYNVLRSHNY